MTNGDKEATITIAKEGDALGELRQALEKGRAELSRAIDLSFAADLDAASKQHAAQLWEDAVKDLVTYVRVKGRDKGQNIMSWLGMIDLKRATSPPRPLS